MLNFLNKYNFFNLSKNPNETSVFKDSSDYAYLSLASILYFLCGLVGTLGLFFCYNYVNNSLGSYSQLGFGLAITLGLGATSFELNQKQALPTLNFVITISSFVYLLLTIFGAFSNFLPNSLSFNQPTSGLIFAGAGLFAIAFQKIQKSQVLFMAAMLSLNTGICLSIIWAAQNWRSDMILFLGGYERTNLLITLDFTLLFLLQTFLFANYHFLMNKGYKAISHLGTYIAQTCFFISILAFLSSVSGVIFGGDWTYRNQGNYFGNQLVDIAINFLFLPVLAIGIYLSKHLKNDLSKAISIVFGFIWFLIMLGKISTLLNFNDLFPVYVGISFIAIATGIGFLASKLKK